jgi:hypothetical protein
LQIKPMFFKINLTAKETKEKIENKKFKRTKK